MKSSLQMRHLHYVVVLSKEENFGRAANVLAISQPALSQAVQQLERHFGVSIVQRQQSGFQGFTREGKEILAWARQAVGDHDRLVKEAGNEHPADLRGSLRLSFAPASMSIVSLLTTPFAERYPSVTISIKSRTLPQLEQDFRNFDVDLGVNYLDAVELTGLRPYHLYNETYDLLVPDGHYLSDRESIGWKEVGELPLCLLAPSLQNRAVLNDAFAQVGVKPKTVIETDCGLGLFAHMRSQKWLTVVPKSYLNLIGELRHVRSIPIDSPVLTSAVGLLIHDRSQISPITQAFLDVAEEAQVDEYLNGLRADHGRLKRGGAKNQQAPSSGAYAESCSLVAARCESFVGSKAYT